MKLVNNINRFINEKIVIHCNNKENYIKFLKILDKYNLKWSSGKNLFYYDYDRTPYHCLTYNWYYKEFNISIPKLSHYTLRYYKKRNHKILNVNEFINSNIKSIY